MRINQLSLKRRRLPRFLYALVTALSIPQICLADLAVEFSGFGSIGAGKIFNDNGYFADYDESWSFNTDSVVGLQADITTSNGWSLTSQVVARGFDYEDPESHYEPKFELLFLAYQADDNLRLRAGLIRTPFFLYSDAIEVGYAYPWVRPPIDVYTTASQTLTHMKGMDTTFYQTWGDAVVEWRLAYGYQETQYHMPEVEYTLELDPLMGSILTVDWNNLQFRYALYRASQSLFDPRLELAETFFRGFSQTDPIFDDIADSVGSDNLIHYYHMLGVQQDFDSWTVTSEALYVPAPDEQLSLKQTGIYLSLAKQIGKYSPYVSASYYKAKPSRFMFKQLDQSETVIAPGQNPVLDFVRHQTRDAYDSLDFGNTRYALGMRYDVNENIDIKSEIEYYSLKYVSDPVFTQEYPTHQLMLSFVLDWVF